MIASVSTLRVVRPVPVLVIKPGPILIVELPEANLEAKTTLGWLSSAANLAVSSLPVAGAVVPVATVTPELEIVTALVVVGEEPVAVKLVAVKAPLKVAFPEGSATKPKLVRLRAINEPVCCSEDAAKVNG